MSTAVEIAARLASAVGELSFSPPVTHVYNPLEYAWAAHERYLRRYAGGRKEAIFLGMNPGPWGMAQTGVPFGEIGLVRDWLGIEAPVGRPAREHPKRPVLGFDCRRSEVSGRRLWGWFRDTCQRPEHFFRRFLVMNYCPLVFMEASGRNRTPNRLPVEEAAPLLAACDAALRDVVEATGAGTIVGVGRFAEHRARSALEGLPVAIGGILHPSPANPAANRGWAEQAAADLAALGLRPCR